MVELGFWEAEAGGGAPLWQALPQVRGGWAWAETGWVTA